jgi:DNA-binding CsgD family transcriptional regulator
VLAEAGDLAAAEQVRAATLAQVRDAGDLTSLGELLAVIADADLRAGRAADAAAHLREAAQIALSTGVWFTILNVLEGCGYLCAATGRPADAITAWAAQETLERQGGFRDPDSTAHRREDALRDAWRVLGPDRARAAGQRGAAMSLATAAEYALLLTTPSPPPAQAGPGTAKLSTRERELVTLVAQGRTDAQIATQLYIIPQAAAALGSVAAMLPTHRKGRGGPGLRVPARPASMYQTSDVSSSTDASVSTCSTAALTRWWGRVLCTAQ